VSFIRILLGDPDCPLALRGQEEDNGDAIAAKIRNLLLAYYWPCAKHPRIRIRLHRITLYNSIFWFDDDTLVNTRAYGVPAHFAAVLHLRHLSFGPKYVALTTLEQVKWNNSTIITGDVAEEVAAVKSQHGPTSRFTAAWVSSRRCSSTISSTCAGGSVWR